MKKLAIMLPVVLMSALAVEAAGSKTLTQTVPAGNIETVQLESGIGDVTIMARDGAEEVTIEVVLTPRRGGIFSSKRQAEREVDAASLDAAVRRDRLTLRIGSPESDDDRRFEERWTIELPPQLALKLEHGVGDIVIDGMRAGIELDSGVGDVTVEVSEGDVTIDVGVGTAKVRAPAAAYGSAEAAGGVGSARLTVLGETMESGGFVSKASSWTGNGRDSINVAVGVGDAVVELN